MTRSLLVTLTTTLCTVTALVAGCEVTTTSLGSDGGVDAGRTSRSDGGSTIDLPVEPTEPRKDAGQDAQISDAGDADAEAADADAESPPPRKRVFVTKTQYNGDLKTAGAGTDGLDGADKLCAAAATEQNLGGTWRAWLSTATVDAASRIADVAPWYLVDRTTLVFETKAQLAMTPAHAIDKNETGSVSLSGAAVQRVWTGTVVGGTKAPSHCTDWTVSATGTGGVGAYTESSGSWTRYVNDTSIGCTDKNPIYCFEQ